MRFIPWFAAIGLASVCLAQTSPAPKRPIDQLIPWLLNEDQQLRGVPFSELIFDTTGRKVLPFETDNAVDQRVAKAIGGACDETMKRLNAQDSAIQNIDRINELSSHFEDTLRELLNKTPGLQCDFPLTVEGKVQRETGSGSPHAAWKFTRWDLVDLSRFTVKLKAEFQGSNRDMYRPEAIVASSAK